MIYFKNTLSGQKEEFEPINSDLIRMYNCGPTVYGKVHIGNMRAYVFADLIKNTLKYNGYAVKQVINITDVGHLTSDNDEGDDKIETQAQKENLTAHTITQKYTEYFMQKMEDLNIKTDSIIFPKASAHIQEQINLILILEKKGFTYKISDGVYFDTSKFPAYGELGHIHIKGLQEGARIESNLGKRNSTDFALWKFSKEQRQQEWESPWGIGFPGWHIECSAMAFKELGATFDIHTGGIDHIPTHHQNEIAQSVAAHDMPLANYWLHVNHIMIDGKKISKSIGNTIYLEDLHKEKISPIAYKYWLYTSHYSTLSNFTWESVRAAQVGYNKIKDFLARHTDEDCNLKSDTISSSNEERLITYKQKFLSHINNDLNTPQAIALIFELLKDEAVSNLDKRTLILDFDTVLRLGFNIQKSHTVIPEHIFEYANRRQIAREKKDFALADALREKIEESGFMIKDTDDTIGYKIEVK